MNKEEAPKRKVNTRGVLKVDGYNDFNPEMNVQLSRQSAGGKAGKGKKKEGCCK